MEIEVDGYGPIYVEVPERSEWSISNIEQAIADGVLATLQLVNTQTQKDRWHPVLGKGGYVNEVD